MRFAKFASHRALFVAAALVAGQTAMAASLTYTATGLVTTVDPALASAFSVGDTWVMTYTIESTTAPRAGSNSNFAAYDAMLAQSFTLNGYAGSATGSEEIQVDNDPGAGFNDRYSPGPGAGSIVSGADVNGLSLLTFYFVLTDSTDTAFSDALILPLNLSLSDFDGNFWTVDFVDEFDNVYSVSGTLNSLVPEPSGMALLALGCVGLLGYRRRRARIA